MPPSNTCFKKIFHLSMQFTSALHTANSDNKYTHVTSYHIAANGKTDLLVNF